LPISIGLFAQIKREKGKLDSVFANAGVAKYSPFAEITEELYDSIFNVNVKGLIFTVQKALPLLPDGASIILNASVVGRKGLSANSVYAATKAAVRLFARTWTTDLKDRRIRVNAVSPGPIDTPGLHDLVASSEAGQQRMATIPLRFGSGDWGHPMRSLGPWCFSHPMTPVTSRERNCLWMAVLHKCRPSVAGSHAINNCCLFSYTGEFDARVVCRSVRFAFCFAEIAQSKTIRSWSHLRHVTLSLSDALHRGKVCSAKHERRQQRFSQTTRRDTEPIGL
jgi:hypothetical protein